jgi:hypothetical protein
MKNTYKQLQKVIRIISKCHLKIEQTKMLPYYKAFGRCGELEDDIKALQDRIASLEVEKQDLIEIMQAELEKLKVSHAYAA